MFSLFNLLALAALSQGVVVTESRCKTKWVTVHNSGHAHSVSEVASVSVAPASSTLSFPSTTTLTVPLSTGDFTVVLTLNSAGDAYGLPSTLLPEDSSKLAFLTDLGHATTTSTEPDINNFHYSAQTLTSAEPTTEAAPTTEAPTPQTTEAPVVETSVAPAKTTSADSGSSDLSDLAKECVDYHNKVRAVHQVGPVTWDDNIAQFAANYLNGNCNFAHSGGPYGENIAMGYSSATAAMKAWYDENKDYDYSAGQFGMNTGHFTQMVWKNTKKIGCAQTKCDGSNYLVCEYTDERGNIIGYFTENVFPSA